METRDTFFAGLQERIKTEKEFQKNYDQDHAFNFNLFDFFKPLENEISQILKFFLDPKEKHGQGKIFLDTFLQRFELDKEIPVDSKIELKCEYCNVWLLYI